MSVRRPAAIASLPVDTSDRKQSSSGSASSAAARYGAMPVSFGADSASASSARSRVASRRSRTSASITRYGSWASADPRAKLLARVRRRERQLAAQRDDVLEIQIGGLPAREPRRLSRHLRSDAGIAVAIAANPRSETYWRNLARKCRAAGCRQRAIDGAQILRKRIPEALLEHHKPRTHFVEGVTRARRTSSVCQAAAISR